jgi:hypothetical protein
MVRNLEEGKEYAHKGKSLGKFIKKTKKGSGGSGQQEPYFNVEFEKETLKFQNWDNKFEKVSIGGKKTRKRKYSGRKTYRRRR